MTLPLSEIQSLSPSAQLELFVLDLSTIPNSSNAVYRFHAGTNGLGTPVVWQGNPYTPLPIKTEGFEWNGKGTLPRPKLTVASLDGVIGDIVHTYNDLIGAKVTLKRMCAKHLDDANFAHYYNGVSSTADPTACWPDEPWFIERKVSETKDAITFELITPLDSQTSRIPKRRVVANACGWIYKSADCGYAGTNYFTADDTPTTIGNDICGKRLSSCKCRFGATVDLPFGAFPGTATGR